MEDWSEEACHNYVSCTGDSGGPLFLGNYGWSGSYGYDGSGESCHYYVNCTGDSGGSFISGNWTDRDCLPKSLYDLKLVSLSLSSAVAGVSIVANVVALSSFLYLVLCRRRIKRKFIREFSFIHQPVFLLVCHLCVCNLLYCLVGLPNYWLIYYYGGFPLSNHVCIYGAFFRDATAYAGFYTLAAISLTLLSVSPFSQTRLSRRLIIMIIIMIWVWSFVISSGTLFGFIGNRGFILILAVLMPFITIFLAFMLIVRDLNCLRASQDSNTDEAQPNTQMFAFKLAMRLLAMMTSYFVFILPICITEWVTLSEEVSPKFKVVINSWHLLIYVINVIMFVFFDPRCREAICLFFKDIKSVFCISSSKTSSIASNEGDCTKMSTESWSLESFDKEQN